MSEKINLSSNYRLDKGYLGEQDIGFYFGPQGYIVIDGPGGEAGHKPNQRGFDGVLYHPRMKKLIIYDNKAYRATSSVGKASALDANLQTNLRAVIDKVKLMQNLPYTDEVLRLLERTERAVKQNKVLPTGVDLAITNAWGNSTAIGRRLAKRGVKFMNINSIPTKSPLRAGTLQQTRVPFIVPPNPRAAGWAALAYLLDWGSGWLQEKALQRQFTMQMEEKRPWVEQILAEGLGVLLVIEFVSSKAATGFHQVFLNGIYLSGGKTRKDAMEKWINEPQLLPGVPKHFESNFQYQWLPPGTTLP